MDFDRAIVCGCHKFLQIYDLTRTATETIKLTSKWGYNLVTENYYYLCDDTGSLLSSPSNNPEQDGTILPENVALAAELKSILECYIAATDPNLDPNYTAGCSNSLLSLCTPCAAPNRGITNGYTMHKYVGGVCEEGCFDPSKYSARITNGWECGACSTTA